jgi:ATP-dependent DNA helicase 2 subunit 1
MVVPPKTYSPAALFQTVSGSKCLFTALLRRLVARDSVAVCRCVARRGSPPRFVALVPQDEELDEHGVQVAPPGFHLIPLPFADDFRNVTLEKGLPQGKCECTVPGVMVNRYSMVA